MQINGREVRFLLTTGAMLEIAKLCPDGDIAKIGELFDSGRGLETTVNVLRMGVAMSKGHAEAEAYAGREAEKPLSEGEALALPLAESQELMKEIMAAFVDGKKQNIATEKAEEKNA